MVNHKRKNGNIIYCDIELSCYVTVSLNVAAALLLLCWKPRTYSEGTQDG